MKLTNISPEKLDFNVFTEIGKNWTLISAYDGKRDDKKIGTMTASWGGAGVLWNKNVFFCFVRPQRFTKEFIDASDTVTLSFFDVKYKDALTFCGRNSGRDCDKISESGLTPDIHDGAVFFEESRLTLVGKKLFAQYMDKESFCDKALIPLHYPNGDLHMMYVCEITGIYSNN